MTSSRAGWRAGSTSRPSITSARSTAPDTLGEPVSMLSLNFLGFDAREPPFSHELVRQGVRPRARPQPAGPVVRRRRAAGDARRRDPAGDARAFAQGRDRARSGARAAASRRGRASGWQGLPELELVVPSWLAEPEAITDQWAQHLGGAWRRAPGRRTSAWTTSIPARDMFVTGWTADFPDPEGLFLGLLTRGFAPLLPRRRDRRAARAGALPARPERAHAPLPRDRPHLGARAGRAGPAHLQARARAAPALGRGRRRQPARPDDARPGDRQPPA